MKKLTTKEFNELIFEIIRRRGCCRPAVSELIPEFVRPADADQEAVFWWITSDKQRRMEFLEYLVSYYAYVVDKEE